MTRASELLAKLSSITESAMSTTKDLRSHLQSKGFNHSESKSEHVYVKGDTHVHIPKFGQSGSEVMVRMSKDGGKTWNHHRPSTVKSKTS